MIVKMILLNLLLVSASMNFNVEAPKIKREFRAAWVATVDNIDWPSKRDLSTEKQKEELLNIIKKCHDLNLNAIILQIRPACDALYESKIEPWSEYLTGKQGQAPKPLWDPLKFAVDECHKRGMELHTWFNPYRAKHPSMKGELASSHIAKTNPSLAKAYGNLLWLDPGEPTVMQRSLDVMLDVVSRYDIDGVHIDDYFYPYPVRENGKVVPFPDATSYQNYRATGGNLKLNDWRRDNVNRFVQKLYQGIKSKKRWVKFGISPFGIYRPGVPESIKAGIDQYDELYADALLWYQKGWCDYFTPQLYWPTTQTPQSYPVLLNWWDEQNKSKRHLWIGNYTSRLMQNAQNWSVDELVKQIELTRGSGATGNVHFSMKALMQDSLGVASQLRKGVYAKPALIPESLWLAEKKPHPPVLLRQGTSVQIEDAKSAKRSRYALYENKSDKWELVGVFGGDQPKISIPDPTPRKYAISRLDRAQQQSEMVIVQ